MTVPARYIMYTMTTQQFVSNGDVFKYLARWGCNRKETMSKMMEKKKWSKVCVLLQTLKLYKNFKMIKNLCKAIPDFLCTVSTPHKEILTHTHTLSLAVIHEKIIKQKFKRHHKSHGALWEPHVSISRQANFRKYVPYTWTHIHPNCKVHAYKVKSC